MKKIKVPIALIVSIFAAALLPQLMVAGVVNSSQTISSRGAIAKAAVVYSVSIDSLLQPLRVGIPTLISGHLSTTAHANYPDLPICIEYSQDQSYWLNISNVTADSIGNFETTFSFIASGTYFVRAECSNQVNIISLFVADRIVSLDGSGDSTNIQTAIDSLSDSGGIVYIRSGLYNLQGYSIVLRSNLTLFGSGIDRTIFMLYPTIHYSSMSVEDAITSKTDISNVHLENFTIIQNAVPLNHHGGVVLRGGKNYNITLRNLKVTDASGDGISIQRFENLLIENCILERAWTGILFQNGSTVSIRSNIVKNTVGDVILSGQRIINAVVEDNYLESVGDTGIDVSSGQGGPHEAVTVRSNTLKNAGGIRITNSIDVQVTDNVIENGEIGVDAGLGRPIDILVQGNHIVSNGRVGIGFYGAQNSSALSNTINMLSPTDPTQEQVGMLLAIWTSGQIINNTILNSAQCGIDFGGWKLGGDCNITIINNRIQEFGEYGIYDDNQPQNNVLIENNIITSTRSSAKKAIYTENPLNEWIIQGNTLQPPSMLG
jgi:hypothetical protein